MLTVTTLYPTPLSRSTVAVHDYAVNDCVLADEGSHHPHIVTTTQMRGIFPLQIRTLALVLGGRVDRGVGAYLIMSKHKF